MPWKAIPDFIRSASASELSVAVGAMVLIVWLANQWFAKERLPVRQRIYRNIALIICTIAIESLALRGWEAFRPAPPKSDTQSVIQQSGNTISQSGEVNVNANTGTIQVERPKTDSSNDPKRKAR